jgi:tRNA (guanine9-N1)-methyltransferase
MNTDSNEHESTTNHYPSSSQPIGTGLSKNRQKKLIRRERAREAKADRKQREREERLAKAKLEGRDLQAEEQFRVERTLAGDSKRRRQRQWENEKIPIIDSNFQICLDCSFDNEMTDREIASLASQIRYCYSYNKRAVFPCQFTVASLSGRTWQRLQKETGFDEWQHRGFCSTDQHFVEHYKDGTSHRKQGLVYLTSDSDNIISHLETDKIYIIGGIVDRNRLKGIALHKAKEYNICHARLPLETCLAKLPTTKVLTCNHVFGILLKYREHGSDWAKALQDVLPSRKAAEY